MSASGFDLLLRAIDVSFDRRKLGIAVLGWVVGVVFLALLGAMADAIGADTQGDDVVTAVITLIALLAVWVISALATGAIAKLGYDDLSGQPAIGACQALVVAWRHLGSLLLAPLLLGIGVGLFYVVEVILSLPGRIPAAGPIWSALIYLPLAIVNVGLWGLALFGSWLIPVVVVAEGTGPLPTLRRLIALVRGAPGRLAAYAVVTLALALATGLVLLALLGVSAVSVMAIQAIAAGEEPGLSPLAPFGLLLSALPYALMGEISPAQIVAVLIQALASLLLGAVVLAIPLQILPLTCGCAVYLSLRGTMPAPAVPVPVAPAPQPGTSPMPAPAATPGPSPAPTTGAAPQAAMPGPTPAAAPGPAAPAVTPGPSPIAVPGPSAAAPAVAPAPPPAIGPAAGVAPVAPQAAPKARFCSHCGAPVSQTARFCGRCGRALS